MDRFTLTRRLVPHLLVNYSNHSSCSLMSGKMGGALFFSLYARSSGIAYYDEYSDDLIDDVYNHLNKSMPIGFAYGLCGIGWAIEYMLGHHLMEGDSDEILNEIDQKVMEIDPCKIIDKSFAKGLWGIFMYVLTRLESFDRGRSPLPFDKEYLSRLHTAINHNLHVENNTLQKKLRIDYDRFLCGRTDYSKPLEFPDFMFQNLPHNIENLNLCPLGIERGLTGLALKNILQ